MSRNLRVIRLDAIRENARLLRSLVPPTATLMAVVKADAYGHGAVPTARAAMEGGATALAVATAAEGAELRDAGITAPILVLGAVTADEAPAGVAHGLIQTVCTPAGVHLLAEAAARQNRPARCHLKLDTGMHRIGARTPDEVRAVLDALRGAPAVQLCGAYTHFADCDGEDMAYTREQLRRFRALTALLPAGLTLHCANSAAIPRLMPEAVFDMVRMGISLYGYPPVPTELPLRPAMRWESEITHVKTIAPGDCVSYGCTWRAEKPTRVATIACGYGDGYHRAASGQAMVLIQGRRVPVIGRICMDQMMADVTAVPGAQPGDRVILIGRDGHETVTADDIARWAGTIPYEVLLSGTGRVTRQWEND